MLGTGANRDGWGMPNAVLLDALRVECFGRDENGVEVLVRAANAWYSLFAGAGLTYEDVDAYRSSFVHGLDAEVMYEGGEDCEGRGTLLRLGLGHLRLLEETLLEK